MKLFVTVVADSGDGSDSEWEWDKNEESGDESEGDERNAKSDSEPKKSDLKNSKKYNRIVRVLNVEADFLPGKQRYSTRLKFEGHILERNQKNGDTTYWACGYRKKGCRVTAVTKGFVLEKVTGEHSNHVKKLSEKDHRLKKNKKGYSYQDRKCVNYDIEATFLQGKKGGTILKDLDGFTYEKNQGGNTSSGLNFWRCLMYKKYGCTCRATTVGMKLNQITGTHDHTKRVPKRVTKLDIGDDRRVRTHKDYWRKKKQDKKLWQKW